MKARENLTLDELQKQVEWHDSVGAGLELLRRLRAVERTLLQALALVKGTAEAATGGEGTEK